MNNLVMLTKFYPYGTGEAFIENEIDIFSKEFSKIIIIACEVPRNEMRIRNVPKNVIVYKIESKEKKYQTIRDLIFSIKNIIRPNNEFREELKICKGLKEKIFLSYFEEKSSRVYREIVKNKILSEVSEEGFILYSYWLFMTARVGSLIMNNYNNIKYSICRAHRYDLYSEENKVNYLPYREMLLRVYDKILPCSENGTNYLKIKYPQYKEKIKTALLGTLDNGINESSKDNVFRILSCSRIETVKRVEKIVEALTILNNDKYSIEWTHIGGGSLFELICKMSEERLNNIRVNLLGDIDNFNVLNYYKKNNIDLFVNVSSSEGLPVSIMEAISFGIPIVATDVGGTAEIVINNFNGKLLPVKFKDEMLANTIKEIIELKNKSEYEIMRKNSRKLWEENFKAIFNYKSLCEDIAKELENVRNNK